MDGRRKGISVEGGTISGCAKGTRLILNTLNHVHFWPPRVTQQGGGATELGDWIQSFLSTFTDKIRNYYLLGVSHQAYSGRQSKDVLGHDNDLSRKGNNNDFTLNIQGGFPHAKQWQLPPSSFACYLHSKFGRQCRHAKHMVPRDTLHGICWPSTHSLDSWTRLRRSLIAQ